MLSPPTMSFRPSHLFVCVLLSFEAVASFGAFPSGRRAGSCLTNLIASYGPSQFEREFLLPSSGLVPPGSKVFYNLATRVPVANQFPESLFAPEEIKRLYSNGDHFYEASLAGDFIDVALNFPLALAQAPGLIPWNWFTGQNINPFSFDIRFTPTIETFARMDFSPSSSALNGFGRELSQAVRGSTFVDLGAGHPSFSVTMPVLAQVMGAKRYVAVDASNVKGILGTGTPVKSLPHDPEFTVSYVRDDILNFLKRYQRPGPSVFFISGLEPKHPLNDDDVPNWFIRLETGRAYVKEAIKTFQAFAQPGDCLVVGSLVTFIGTRSLFSSLYGLRWKSVSLESLVIDPKEFGFALAAFSTNPERPTAPLISSYVQLWKYK